MRIDLDWTPERLREFLTERHYDDGRPMATEAECPAIDSTHDGVQVIELLKTVHKNSIRASHRRRSRTVDSTPDRR